MPRHSFAELMEYEAHFYNAATFCALPQTIESCIATSTASNGHRLGAATLAMIHADNHGDEVKARSIHSAVHSLEPATLRERIDWFTIEAVFHAAFGDQERLPAVLSDLVEVTRRVQHPVLRAVLLRRAAWGLLRFGPRSLARDILNEAISVFDRLSLHHQLIHSIEHLCLLEIEDERYQCAHEYLGRLQSIGAERPGFYAHAVEYEIRVRLAFEQRSVQPLVGFNLQESALAPFKRAPRSRLLIAAAELGHRLLTVDYQAIAAKLRVVMEQYPTLKNRCNQDFVVASMALALRTLDQGSEAHVLVTDYLESQRRENDFLLPSLKRISSELNVKIPERFVQSGVPKQIVVGS
jgi:hypothetical protein